MVQSVRRKWCVEGFRPTDGVNCKSPLGCCSHRSTLSMAAVLTTSSGTTDLRHFAPESKSGNSISACVSERPSVPGALKTWTTSLPKLSGSVDHQNSHTFPAMACTSSPLSRLRKVCILEYSGLSQSLNFSMLSIRLFTIVRTSPCGWKLRTFAALSVSTL